MQNDCSAKFKLLLLSKQSNKFMPKTGKLMKLNRSLSKQRFEPAVLVLCSSGALLLASRCKNGLISQTFLNFNYLMNS